MYYEIKRTESRSMVDRTGACHRGSADANRRNPGLLQRHGLLGGTRWIRPVIPGHAAQGILSFAYDKKAALPLFGITACCLFVSLTGGQMHKVRAARRRKLHIARAGAYFAPALAHSAAPPLRKKARSHRLSPWQARALTPIGSLPLFFGKPVTVMSSLPTEFSQGTAIP